MNPTPIAAAVRVVCGIGPAVLPLMPAATWTEAFGPAWLQRQRWEVAGADAAIEHVKKLKGEA